MRRLGNPARDTFNVPYDLFPPLLIKLLITFGCYRHRGDIPQVLSAVRAPENPRRGTPPPHPSPSVSLLQPLALNKVAASIHYSRPYAKVCFLTQRRRIQMASFIAPLPSFYHRHPSPFVGPPLWPHCRGFCSPSSCLEMRTRHGPLRAFTRYCYVSKPIN